MKIYAPVKNANGVYASVRFVNGVGETYNPRLIEWFKSHGYKVPIVDDESSAIGNISDESEFVDINKIANDEPEMMGYAEKKPIQPDFENMTPYELREWMLANGYNVRNTRSKDKLLEILRG